MSIASEKPCLNIFLGLDQRISRSININQTYNLSQRLIHIKNYLHQLYKITDRLAKLDRFAFNNGDFVAGPVHLLVFTPHGLKFIVNYEYARILFNLKIPSIISVTQGYLGLKDYIAYSVDENRFHAFTTRVSASLRKKQESAKREGFKTFYTKNTKAIL